MNENNVNSLSGLEDVEQVPQQQEGSESTMRNKFTKFVTIMFTDLKGATSIAETEGHIVSHLLINMHDDIVMPAIQQNNGVFVKSIGNGTLSYFDNAQDAVRTAVWIQRAIDELNMVQKFKTPVLIRIGLHSGMCIVEKNDIFGNAVNISSYFGSSATMGNILMSEDTYKTLIDKSEIHCRFVKQMTLKGKKKSYNAYKVFWNPQEIERDKTQENGRSAALVAKSSYKLKLILIVLIPMLLVLALTLRDKISSSVGLGYETRSINYSIGASERK